jgi:hypothetical protein
MPWRKWLVRGLVFTLLGAMALAALLYQAFTNPEAVRRQVLDKLSARFPRAVVSAQSARMQLLGGIAVSELRLSRQGDPDQAVILYVPSAILHVDKEHLLGGGFALRKVELIRPHLHLVRERDGRLNLSGLAAPTAAGERLPMLVVRQGTVVFEDRAASPGVPLAEFKEVNLTVVNDPAPVLTVEGSGRCDVAGAVRFSARIQRGDGATTASVEAPAVAVGPPLVQRLAGPWPELARHLLCLRGTGRVKATLAYTPLSARPLTYDVVGQLTGGEFSHARLPFPVDHLEASVHVVNGQAPRAHVSGRAGDARLDLTLTDLTPPPRDGPFDLYDLVRELDLKLERLPVTPELFGYLPESVRELEEIYRPRGLVSMDHHFQREGDGWRKRWRLEPEGMSGECKYFPYRLERIVGSVAVERASGQGGAITVDLTGFAADRPVTVKGTVLGERGRDGVDLTIQAERVAIDDKLLNGLTPYPKTRALAGQFHVAGLTDVQAFVRRPPGGGPFSNRFLIRVHDAQVNYDLFPYPLTEVNGLLEVLPDHWVCREFHGRRQGGAIHVSGRSFPQPPEVPGAAPRPAPPPGRMRLAIQGTAVPLDEAFEGALAPSDAAGRKALGDAYKVMRPSGRLDFEAEVLDRGPQDLDVAVAVHGASVRPKFFDYSLDQVSGLVRYADRKVTLSDMRGRHGGGVLALKSGLVTLSPGGGYQVWLQRDGDPPLVGRRLESDDDLLAALPHGLKKGMDALRLHGPFDLDAALVVTVKEAGAAPEIWWDGAARLPDNAFQTGVQWADVRGLAACSGLYKNQQLQEVQGHVSLERASLLGQPLRDLHARVKVEPKTPEVLSLYDIQAELFGGQVGGQARVTCGPAFGYDLFVEAVNVQLEQFGRHNFGPNAELQGPALAKLYLAGDGSGLNGLRGSGQVEVPNGKMLRLPPLLGLLSAFGLRAPDNTAFEQAHIAFAIDGPQVRFDELELIGSAVSLSGLGTMHLDGSNLNLDFTAAWGRLRQLLPQGASEVPRAVSNLLFKIKVRGKVGDVHYDKVFVPSVADWFKGVLGGT